jgi:hypothetical protein
VDETSCVYLLELAETVELDQWSQNSGIVGASCNLQWY